MSQNFSNNSDIFIPELIELESYWQKAVEDAICDTLKGEKRLLYALRNRKKINQKLEKLGLKPVPTQLSFQKSVALAGESNEKIESTSDFSVEEGKLNSDYSRTENDESRQEKNQRTPDRPLLAAGSLEKMKKSQNSFNYEPMGVGGSNEDLSESNEEDVEDHREVGSEKNKKIQWLHVRDDGNFDESDSETTFALRRNEKPKNSGSKHISHKDKNFVAEGLRLPHADAAEGRDKSQGEDKTTPNATPSLRRKMHLVLSKKDVADTNRASTTRSNSAKVKVKVDTKSESPEKKKQDKTTMPPFIRFYLELYREFCHKYSPKHITEEAARRWWAMSDKQKSLYSY